MKLFKNLLVLAALGITIFSLAQNRYIPDYKFNYHLKKDTVVLNKIDHLDHQIIAKKEKMEESLVGFYQILKFKIPK